MCGVAGYIGNVDDGLGLLRQLNRNQRHRGPDDQGQFVSDCGLVGLAMTRLSIVDHQRGHQPMTIDDGALVIVFNGEIFNAVELRSHLERKYGEQFDTNHSDTEVVLRMYKYYGSECFEKLNGMFAVVIYDRTKRRVTLCRDYFGIKPLVYSLHNNRIIFSSEIRALRDIKGLGQSLDNLAISHYLDFGYINAPYSIYDGIRRLQAGHIAEMDLRTMSMEVKAWKKRIKPSLYYNQLGKRELEQKINKEFCSAVERWSIADVPLCYSLSGGLDSSAIAGAASRGTKIETYSVGYKSSEFDMWNEIGVASKISKEIQSQHNEIIINISDVESDINRMIDIFAEPYGGGLPSYYLFKAANANGHRVIMTGVGGDELFGNYGNAALYKKTFPSLRSFEISKYIDSIYLSYKKNPDIPSLKSPDLSSCDYELDKHLSESLRGVSCIEECVHIFDENTQLPNEFLSMIDLLSMSFSVEARTPFLDMRFANFVLSIPTELRTSSEQEKELMIRSLHDVIPSSALGRKKSGFSLPLSILMRQELRERFSTLMSRECLKGQGCYNDAVFDFFIKPFTEGDNRFVAIVWRLFALQWWFLESGYLK